MNRHSRVADATGGQALSEKAIVKALAEALVSNALPDEIADFAEADRIEAARFVAATAHIRQAGRPNVHLESAGGTVGRRRMRLAVVNDDMPFLVDSLAAAIAARGLTVHRLLHPVLCVDRDADGMLSRVEPFCEDLPRRESFIYVEIDRAPASIRRSLVARIDAILADVRAAVEDWSQLQAHMDHDADRLGNEEGAALLHWFAEGAMTLLGYHVERPGSPPENALGLLKLPGELVWDPDSSTAAIHYFRTGGQAPLIAKADRRSSVHRRVPFDLVVMPIDEDGDVKAIGVHAGLWTSQALSLPADQVPVLRRRLDRLQEEFGVDPRGHAGKALRHAIDSLPSDLLVSLRPESIKQLVATAMSLADRPRPAVELLPSILRAHVFAFVWLPRDELATRRRIAIGEMLEQATDGVLSSWSIELGDGDLSLLRYTIDVDPARPLPDAEALNLRLHDMLRGWEPAVEEAVAARVGVSRATRLALSTIPAFPESYRSRTDPQQGAEDAIRFASLRTARQRIARLFRLPGDDSTHLRLNVYRLGDTIPLSQAVPVFENFGFQVLEEQPTSIGSGAIGHIHEFLLQSVGDVGEILDHADVIEAAIGAVLEGKAENDSFNSLLVAAALEPSAIVLLRAWFRYLRQIGLSYGMATAVEALRKAPAVARALIDLFHGLHDPAIGKDRDRRVEAAIAGIVDGLANVAAIDEDRVLRLYRCLVEATMRTNVFTAAGAEALAFKFDSKAIPDLPAPVPWREIWVYSPRVEGIHLRGGPIARGGIRWSDRRDDFRTEVLGLMKAQVVKNAVIVPTGAKGGFYPKKLPPPTLREAWVAEGTEAYTTYIRALLSVTDNIVDGKVVHPEGMVIRDADDPYFVVAADKGTATFSDVANAIALSRNFWLGDAFASGGSRGYDHKEIGITARGAWISVRRHFAELGIDVQTQSVRVAGCGDMSGDVFGNGMLLSQAVKLVAAFDHRHIFLDPDPDPKTSWKERKRLFGLRRSSWDDYDKRLLSKGGGIFPRSQKAIPVSPQIGQLLGLEARETDPASLISAILKAPVDLLWFGGIGTFVKASDQNDVEVGDPGNDAVRVDASALRAKVVGEGANLAVTQAGRIEFAQAGGRINTDFIDNSAGVDCSDNEVNIKIPLNRAMVEGKLTQQARDKLLAEMTEDVAALVLEDNRLQTLALSIAELGGPTALPAFVRAIEVLEESGRLDREIEGLDSNMNLLRRVHDGKGLTRPELAVLLSTSKLALQDAIGDGTLPDDPTMEGDLLAAFPKAMQKRHADGIRSHRLRRELIATKVANRFVNRLGILAPFALAEEESASWAHAATGFVAAERLCAMGTLWQDIEDADIPERMRLALFDEAGRGLQLHIADILRSTGPDAGPGEIVELLEPSLRKLNDAVDSLLRDETRAHADAMKTSLLAMGAPDAIVRHIVLLYKMNGAVGIAALARRRKVDELAVTRAYTRLGEVLGLDWAQSAANRFVPGDQWERLLISSIAREFEQLRLNFLDRRGGSDPESAAEKWIQAQAPRIAQFTALVRRARAASVPTIPMLAQIAAQASVLLAR